MTDAYDNGPIAMDKDASCVRSASHSYFTTALGGLVTNAVRMQQVSSVLDLGCSEGAWVLDLARTYPRIRVTGIDKDKAALDEAARFARFHGISNATFAAMDVTSTLDFGDNAFDLIHMRATQFLYDPHFDNILTQCTRVLRPGGWLNLIEFELGATSSIAFDRVLRLFNDTIRKKMSHGSPSVSNVAQLYDVLLSADFLDVSYTVHAVDFSPINSIGARAFLDEVFLALRVTESLVCRQNALSEGTYDALLSQAYEDMTQPDTCGFGYLLSVVGCKNG